MTLYHVCALLSNPLMTNYGNQLLPHAINLSQYNSNRLCPPPPPPRRSGTSSSCSSYYSTSAAKAQLASQIKDHYSDDNNRGDDDDDELNYKVGGVLPGSTPPTRPSLLIVTTTEGSCFFSTLVQKQLMESLRKKLGVLREAQRGLQDDIRANAQLGEEVGTTSRFFWSTSPGLVGL